MAYNYNPAYSLNTDGNAKDVFISGNKAYVADGSKGLKIIDIDLLKNIDDLPDPEPLLGSYDTPGTGSSVYVSGNYAYVADGRKGLQIFDLSDPEASDPVHTYKGNDQVDYQKLSDLSNLKNTNNFFGQYLPDSLLAVYDSKANNWDVLNLDDPDPTKITSFFDSFPNASFPSEFSTSNDAYLSGNYTYVADGASGLSIASINDVVKATLSGDPLPVQSYDTAGTATDVSVSGNFAYVADTTGLQIFDVSNPTQPTTAYIYETNKKTLGVAVDDDSIYVADGGAGLRVLNVIDETVTLEDESVIFEGTNNKELILGSSGADTLKGLGGADVLAGGGDNDKLLGGGGADTMVGGMGDDNLIGGGGADVLIGVNPYEADPGKGEQDTLKGGAGKDTFVLGDENNIFYHDNGLTEAHGDLGIATITDFKIGKDTIQLSSNGSYELVEDNGSTRIYETSGVARDYIAIVSGVTGLNLADTTQFDTVGSIL